LLKFLTFPSYRLTSVDLMNDHIWTVMPKIYYEG